MPIYEYECQSCGHRLEVMQRLNDELLTQCDQCSAEALKKCISAPNFHLKGSGWYATDFKNKDQKTDASAPKDQASDQSGTAAGANDSQQTSNDAGTNQAASSNNQGDS